MSAMSSSLSDSLRRWAGSAAATALVLGAAGAAHAQDALRSTLFNQDIPDDYNRGRNISVLERDHPEYDALGVPLGGFTLYPSATLGGGYLDNVFGTSTGKVGDGYFDIDPQVAVTSNWSRNSVAATVGADIREFVTQTAENEQGWHVLLSGRYDLTNNDYFTGGFTARKLYEEQDSGFYPTGAAAPLGYLDTDTYLRYNHETGRIRLVLSGDYHTFNYDSVAAIGGGSLSQSFNDHNAWRGTAHGEYNLTPDAGLFVEVSHQQNTYTDIGPGGGQDLNGDENRFLVGGNFDLTALIRGSVGLGYIERNYDDHAFRGVSGLAVDAHAEYFPTPLITLSGSVQRTLQDSIDFDAGGFVSTISQARADYELLRSLLLNVEINYENDAYRTVSRTDNITTVGGGATYNLNRNVAVQGYAAYTDRASTGNLLGPVFTETRFVLSLIFKI